MVERFLISVTSMPTTSSIQKRAVIGIQRFGGTSGNDYTAIKALISGTPYDTRIVVTATIPTTVHETTTIQSTEIKNLSTIKIVFRYSF